MIIVKKKSRQVLVLYFTKKRKNEIKEIELENILFSTRSSMGPHVSYRCLVFNHEL